MVITLCDDDPAVVLEISGKISEKYRNDEVRCCHSGDEVLALDDPGDILFLDVQMPGMDGMETARRLRMRDERALIIFLTGYEDKVFEAFEVDAFRYLLKPVSDKDLYKSIDDARERIEKRDDRALSIVVDGAHITVKVSDIVYAEVLNRIIRLHTKNGTFEYYGKMSALENEIGPGFFRSHRSYIVNLSYVSGYHQRDIFVGEGIMIPLAKQKYSEFVKAYMRGIKGEH